MLDIFRKPDIYKVALAKEMKRQGASKEEIQTRITDAIIRNAIRNKRLPEDVVWAIMQ